MGLLAVVLTALPWSLVGLAAVLLVAHGRLRYPSRSPVRLEAYSDGSWRLFDPSARRWCWLKRRTRLGSFWVLLAFAGDEPSCRDVLLLADQLELETWTRLRSLIRRE